MHFEEDDYKNPETETADFGSALSDDTDDVFEDDDTLVTDDAEESDDTDEEDEDLDVGDLI